MSPYLILILFLLGAIVIGSIFAAFLARGFLRPINKLSDSMQKVSHGNFDVRIEGYENKKGDMAQLMNNFNKMATELGKTETLREDFIANVSHEFKTPLSTIQGYSTLLQDENLPSSEKEVYLNYLIDATGQLSNLVNSILKLNKLENGELNEKKTRYDVAEQIRQSLLFTERQWEEKDIDLDIKLAPGEITANEELMMQVWQNVIGNAIKYSDNGGKIIVSSCIDGEYYVVKIKDFGCGMDEETKGRIFEKFFQGDNSHSKEGNGLGLALVKKILDISGGIISVESDVDKGSEFTIRIPLGN